MARLISQVVMDSEATALTLPEQVRESAVHTGLLDLSRNSHR